MTLPLTRNKLGILKYLYLALIPILFFSSTKVFAQQDQQPIEEQSWAKQTPYQYAIGLDKTYTTEENGQIKEGSINLEGYEYVNTSGKIYTLSCILAGYPCTTIPERQEASLQGSMLFQTSNMVATLYEHPPASTGTWIADISQNMGFAKPSYAQGIGFSALSPLLGIWKVMRNIAYALIIVVLLIIGLMVMFRAKIDPRTVISIQSALPRIVMTLILITFSYPIAGLLIDLMYLVLFLGIGLIGPAFPNSTAQDIARFQADFANGGGLGRLYAAIPTGEVAGGAISAFITGALGSAATTVAAGASGLGGAALLGGLALGIGTTVIFLLIVIAFIFAVIRIFFILLNAYIQILISVIFAPILLLGQAFPGQAAFSNWIRNLLANLSVFPTTAILILVADLVTDVFVTKGSTGEILSTQWVPPVIGSKGSLFATLLIPLGFALAIPQLVITIKKLFGAKPIAPVGGSVAKAFGQPIGIVQQTIGTLGQIRLLRGPGGGH